MPVYKIDYRDGRTVTHDFANIQQAKAAARDGMFYTGRPVWICNQEGKLVAYAEWIDGDPGEAEDVLQVVEWEKGVGYYRRWI